MVYINLFCILKIINHKMIAWKSCRVIEMLGFLIKERREREKNN